MKNGSLRQLLKVSKRAIALVSLACLPSVAAASNDGAWSFPSQSVDANPTWSVLEAEEWGGYSCMLVWEYNRQSRVIITRLAEEQVRVLLWRDDLATGDFRKVEAVFKANGQTFADETFTGAPNPMSLIGKVTGGGIAIEVDKTFLRAFAAGRQASFSIDGKSGSPFNLTGTAAARRAFNACKDPSDETLLSSVPIPPPIDMVPVYRPPEPPPPPPPPPVYAPPPVEVTPQRAVSPRNMPRWARRIMENYPPRALREELTGSVGVRVVVNAVGRVASCDVTSSSGHQVLDDAACKGMIRYSRFNPARNDNGDSIESLYSTIINYDIFDPPPVEPVAPEGGSQQPQ
jgi:TonB family protein